MAKLSVVLRLFLVPKPNPQGPHAERQSSERRDVAFTKSFSEAKQARSGSAPASGPTLPAA